MGPKILRFSQISKLTTVLPKGQKSSITLQNYLHNEISFKKFLLEFPPLCNDFFFFFFGESNEVFIKRKDTCGESTGRLGVVVVGG